MTALSQSASQTIDLFHQAESANLHTAGRQGNLVRLPFDPGGDVMVTADLHGHRENFAAILQVANLAEHPHRHLVLQEVCHGGPSYPGKCACKSHLLLEDIARLKLEFPAQVHFILSNHELAEMTDYPIVKGHKLLNMMFRGGLQEEYGQGACEVRDAQVAFLRSLPLGVRLPNEILITHSGPPAVDLQGFDATVFDRELKPADLVEHGAVFQLVWGRDYRPENAEAFAKLMDAKILIHGHDPCPTGCKVPNDTQIILDCCSRPAMYLLVPTDRSLSHADLVQQIRPLP
jgi:hypothetical protein